MRTTNYWRIQAMETNDERQITMLATDSMAADLAQCRTYAEQHPEHKFSFELWESRSIAEWQNEDHDVLRDHRLLLVIDDFDPDWEN